MGMLSKTALSYTLHDPWLTNQPMWCTTRELENPCLNQCLPWAHALADFDACSSLWLSVPSVTMKVPITPAYRISLVSIKQDS